MSVYAKEIAQKLGLSAATVSLALRDRPGVSPRTRQRVLEAAEALGYSRAGATGRPAIRLVLYKRHGAVVAKTDFFSQLVESIEGQAGALGYELLVTYFYASQNAEEQLRAMASSPAAGIILLATEMHTADLQPFKALATPMVVLDSFFPDEDLDCILINNIYGAKHAVQYLISRGHTEIGHLASRVNIRNFYERQEGWLRGLRDIPVANDSRRHLVPVAPTPDGAFADMAAYLSAGPKLPTAFFADNDLIAIACMRALRMAGYRIPQDISVIGFDGIAAGALLDPPLTTMDVPKDQLGASAVNRLHERIHGLATGTLRIQVSTRLVERSSVQALEP